MTRLHAQARRHSAPSPTAVPHLASPRPILGPARQSESVDLDRPSQHATRPGHDFGRLRVHAQPGHSGKAPATAPAPAGQVSGAPPIQCNGFLDNLKNAMGGVFGPKVGPLNQGPRDDLDTNLRQYPHPALFTHMLNMTNRGMGVNTTEPLPSDKAQQYIGMAQQVESGDMSSTSAFAQSSWDWAKRGNYAASGLNAFGAVGSSFYEGLLEHQKRQRGQL